MVNFRYSVLVFTIILTVINAAPSRSRKCKGGEGKRCKAGDYENGEFSIFVDQSQNGTENIRVDIKDVAIIWAPGEALLAAAALLDPALLLLGDDLHGLTDDDEDKPIGQNQDVLDIPSEGTLKPEIASHFSSTPSVIDAEDTSNKTKQEYLGRIALDEPSFIGPFIKRKP